MSGEVQLRRNLKIDIDRVKDQVGGGELKTFNIILHDFIGEEPQEPKIYIKDGIRFVTYHRLLTEEEIAEYEERN